MERIEREPCPYRLVDDAGGAFLFGLVGGTVWHTFGGIRNAPNGQRIAQAISRVKARVPMLGGSFAVWGVLFSACDCTLVYARKKEDPWNAIASGAITGGILAARAGMKAAGRSALAGGVILAAIEGLNIIVMRVLMPRIEKSYQAQGIPIDRLEPPSDPYRPRLKRQPLYDPAQSSVPAPSPLFQAANDIYNNNNNNSNNSSNNNSSNYNPYNLSAPGFPEQQLQGQGESGSGDDKNNSNKSSWKFW